MHSTYFNVCYIKLYVVSMLIGVKSTDGIKGKKLDEFAAMDDDRRHRSGSCLSSVIHHNTMALALASQPCMCIQLKYILYAYQDM